MNLGPELLLVAAVAGVGVLHTMVPDHWVPITLIARQRGWSKAETARAAFQAGSGHVLSTLAIGLIVWFAGTAAAARFGHLIDMVTSMALIAFGGWIAVSAWRELHGGQGHSHGHSHDFSALPDPAAHGPELQRIPADDGEIAISIYETGSPPRFRLTGAHGDTVKVETLRSTGQRQLFSLTNQGAYWESMQPIPEPHEFDVMITIEHGGHAHVFATHFSEHTHASGEQHHNKHGHHQQMLEPAHDPLYAPLRGEERELMRHVHIHRHGSGPAHVHWHDHRQDAAHAIATGLELAPPLHVHRHKTTARTALLLILGSSPMVEGIPAFFAAGKYGVGLIAAMSAVFALSTIATYILLCTYSAAGLQRVRLGSIERYGEVLSGVFIAAVGFIFWLWPVL